MCWTNRLRDVALPPVSLKTGMIWVKFAQILLQCECSVVKHCTHDMEVGKSYQSYKQTGMIKLQLMILTSEVCQNNNNKCC